MSVKKFKDGAEGYLYLLKLNSLDNNPKEEFYKIGICNKGVEFRYRFDKDFKYKIKILFEIPMLYTKAKELESIIKKRYLAYVYNPKYNFGGSSTECFSIMPTVSMTPEHSFTEYFRCETTEIWETNILENRSMFKFDKLNLDIDISRIKKIYVIEKPKIYRHLGNKNVIGYNALNKDLNLLRDFCNLIQNFQKNRLLNKKICNFYMHPNLLQKIKQENFDIGVFKNTNPIKDKYMTNNLIIFDSLVNNVNIHNLDIQDYVKFKLIEYLNSSKYKDGEDVRLFFFFEIPAKKVSEISGIPITYISWQENLLEVFTSGK